MSLPSSASSGSAAALPAERAAGSSAAPSEPAVVFFDVDGTLIWHRPGATPEEILYGTGLSDAVRQAFRRLKANGHLPVLCTGRPTRIIPKALLELDPFAVIADAGAHVRVGDEVIYDVHLEPDEALSIAERFYGEGISVMFEGNDGQVTLISNDEDDISDAGGAVVRTLEDFECEVSKLHVAKFIFYYESGDTTVLEKVCSFVDERFRVFDIGIGMGEGALVGIDKGAAINRLLEHIGHGRENTYGIGDSENDLSMMAAVETSIAMGNALPHVQEAASYVTDSVENDGAPHALEHFGLI